MLPRLEVTLPLLSITNIGGIPTDNPPTKPKGSNAIVHPKIYLIYYLSIFLFLFVQKKHPGVLFIK
jgi:hypothetical protein